MLKLARSWRIEVERIVFLINQPMSKLIRSTNFANHILSKYGIKDAEVECINFEFNATFSVSTDSGQRYALRLNINSTRNEANILAEVQWVRALLESRGLMFLRQLQRSMITLLFPQIHTDSQQLIIGVMYSWLEGEAIGDEPTLQQLKIVGSSIALMHENSSDFALEGNAQLPTFDDFFWGTEDFLFSDKSTLQQEHKLEIQRARDLIVKNTKDLYENSPVHIIHADFHGWNLMWNEGQLSIFDFDDCGFGVEAQDLAVALYYLDTPEQENALLNGYKSVRPLPVYSEKRDEGSAATASITTFELPF
jgi:Ser/Thr protein kinase RdoA (MazF antagonist)